MTLKQAQILYETGTAPNPMEHFSPGEWEDILNELKRVVAAKSDRTAANVVRWWGCWDRTYTAISFARRARAKWQEIKP